MDVTSLVIPGITDPNTLVCIARSRTFKQYRLMVTQALQKKCPFCEVDENVNKVVVGDMCWSAWQSPAPETHTKHHFIIAPLRHIDDTEKLTNDEKLSLFWIMKELRRIHCYQSRGILIRDGDATLSAGTIEHLHVHVMVPDGTGRVESPFYKGEKAERESLERAIVFEKLRQGMFPKNLTDTEMRLIQNRLD